jgi:hypothetical protein
MAWLTPAPAVVRRPARAGSGRSTVSTRLFQALQSGQRPSHFGCRAPHCWQMKTERAFVGTEGDLSLWLSPRRGERERRSIDGSLRGHEQGDNRQAVR